MFTVCIIVMLVPSVVESPLGAAMTVTRQDCTTYERFPLGAGYDRYPSVDWTLVRLNLGPARYRESWFHRCSADCAHLS